MERAAAAVALLACLALRLSYIRHFRLDSDEPQHLHVVWEWLQGRIAYRDFFDNHVPLFHLLAMPFLKLTGERPDALVFMRLWQLPVFAASLWLVYKIGALLFTRRTALWSAVFCGLYPYFFYPTLEFRPDNLWGLLWLAAVLVAIGGPLTIRRCFGVGLLVGLDFCTSMKTSLLLASVLLALAGGCLLLLRLRSVPPFSRWVAAAAGAAIAPGALLFYFAQHNALRPLRYCVIGHNLIASPAGGLRLLIHAVVFVIVMAALWWTGRHIARLAPDETTAVRRVLVFLFVGSFLALLNCFWSIITRQDFIPNDPLLVVLVTPLLLEATRRLFSRVTALQPAWAQAAGPILLVVVGIVWTLLGRPIRVDGPRGQIRYAAQVQELTSRDEYVMDYKGESMFRRRPFYYVLEPMTRLRIHLGLLKDDIPERLIATRTCVALNDVNRLSKPTRQFIEANYLPVGQVRVVGKFIKLAGRDGYVFEVKVPAQYVVADDKGSVAGKMDGQEMSGGCLLAEGRHRFVPDRAHSGLLAVMWERAWSKGCLPFAPPPFEPFESEF